MSTSPDVIPPRGEHKGTVIFMHGLGDQADGWTDTFARSLRHPNIKYILPNAPIRAITRFGGEEMPAWFDRKGMGLDVDEDTEGIEETALMIDGLIKEEKAAGLETSQILVGGFSQGGAMALYVGLSYEERLAAAFCLSSYLPLRDKFPEKCVANRNLPIWMGHGAVDDLVRVEWARDTHALIKQFNPNCTLKIYDDVAHCTSPPELRALRKFIASFVDKADDSS